MYKIEDLKNTVHCADCLTFMKDIPDNSIDSIVTDPPAGISFMGKSWDTDKGGRDNWIKWMQEVATECKRVLKPGGHAFVWAIPRTSHWTATAWENAGFEIRDVVAHVFGSGFPKSHNIGKSVDKLQGNEREDLGYVEPFGRENRKARQGKGTGIVPFGKEEGIESKNHLTKGTSEFEGWGTALKPAREDWILMRKPLDKGLTIAENCLKWGTGGINIDESRVDFDTNNKEDLHAIAQWERQAKSGVKVFNQEGNARLQDFNQKAPSGRFPANFIHDNSEEVRECFPETKGGGSQRGSRKWKGEEGEGGFGGWVGKVSTDHYVSRDDGTGNASRFFKSIIYTAKASKSERNRGCDGLPTKEKRYMATANGTGETSKGMDRFTTQPVANNHPTVKPIALMEYLIKMVTPKGGIVLDPFMGSGTTGIACKNLNRNFIGIELDPTYFEIAKKRIDI